MEENLHQNSMDIAADYSSDDSFSIIDSEFEFGQVIPTSPTDDSILQDPDQDSEFEFGCITPDSPNNDSNQNSPADTLFFNGVLLPHPFPFQSIKNTGNSNSLVTSCTSSSNDSLMSSRSNSSNSRSGSCSSAGTSLSENSEKKQPTSNKDAATKTESGNKDQAKRSAQMFQPYVPTQQWEFIPAAPILTISAKIFRRKKPKTVVQEETKLKKQVKKKSTLSSWVSRKILRRFVSACRECHALEPSGYSKSLDSSS